jgi:hypothetical protein
MNQEKKDLEKRVRSLNNLTAKMVVPACLAIPFDSTYPLPKVLDLQPEENILFSMQPWLSIADTLCLPCYRVTVSYLHVLPFPKTCLLLLKLLLLTLKPPRLSRIRTGMEPKVLWRGLTPLCHLPQLSLKTKVQTRRGNT